MSPASEKQMASYGLMATSYLSLPRGLHSHSMLFFSNCTQICCQKDVWYIVPGLVSANLCTRADYSLQQQSTTSLIPFIPSFPLSIPSPLPIHLFYLTRPTRLSIEIRLLFPPFTTFPSSAAVVLDMNLDSLVSWATVSSPLVLPALYLLLPAQNKSGRACSTGCHQRAKGCS